MNVRRTMPDRNVAVLGAGGIGTLFAVRLAQAGWQVAVGVRDALQARTITAHGLRLAEPGASEVVVLPQQVFSTDAGPARFSLISAPRFALVLVAVKAYATAAVAPMAASLAGTDTWILTLQNGLGNAEALLAAGIAPERLLVGITTEGATSQGTGDSAHLGQGQTILGPWPTACAGERHEPDTTGKWVASELRKAGFAATWQQPIAPQLWSKLAINAAINPIAAILGVRNGALLDLPPALDLMRQAAAEVSAVATARATPLPADPWPRILEVLRATADNRCSMLQDIEAGRQTEIDAICGAIAREGRRLAVATPANEFLWQVVLARNGLGPACQQRAAGSPARPS